MKVVAFISCHPVSTKHWLTRYERGRGHHVFCSIPRIRTDLYERTNAVSSVKWWDMEAIYLGIGGFWTIALHHGSSQSLQFPFPGKLPLQSASQSPLFHQAPFSAEIRALSTLDGTT